MFCISCTSSSGKLDVAKIQNENMMNQEEDILPIDPKEDKRLNEGSPPKGKSYKKLRNSTLVEEENQDLSTLLPNARETDLDQPSSMQTDVKRLCIDDSDVTDGKKKKKGGKKQPVVQYAKKPEKSNVKIVSTVEKKKSKKSQNPVSELEV